jgi:hypothetical protein
MRLLNTQSALPQKKKVIDEQRSVSSKYTHFDKMRNVFHSRAQRNEAGQV